MKRMICIGLLAIGCINTGCMVDTKKEAIERKADAGIAMMRAALEKGIEELSSQSAALAGSGSLINPGYEVEVFGGFGPTFWGRTTVRVIGGSATITANSQMGPPNRNVETFGESKLPPTE